MIKISNKGEIDLKPRVAFYTLGCKLNFSETATIARDFHSDKFNRVSFDSPAEVYIINTCSVTENADMKFKGVVKSYEMNADNTLTDATISGYKIVSKKVMKEKNGWRTMVLLEFNLI